MKCEKCKKPIAIGDWPYCPHGPVQSRKGFEPYWDEHIADTPVWISDPGDRTKHLKPHWKNDHIEHVQPRDKSESYYRELNERRAHRAEQERRERR